MTEQQRISPKRPNVILILADDMGFSDLGCTGSEINTPNLDQLAKNGVLLSALYNCARCCPTRASLLTGLYPSQAGIGHMGTHLGTESYQGFLRNDAGSIAEHLKADGYRTYMSGKWHVAGDFEPRDYDLWRPGDLEHPTPLQRGFDEFYGIVDGAAHYFSPHYLMENDQRITDLPDGFYFTDAITDKAITMIKKAMADDDPFFLYLAHTAPHWPLHALPDDIARYDGVYQNGWDAIRTARHETLNGSGVLQAPWDISPRDDNVHPWQDEPNKDWETARMAAYAAMVDRMDQSIGRLVQALKAAGQFENTLLLFLSDNGGCAEFMAEDGWAQYYPDLTHAHQTIIKGNIPGLIPGDAQTFQSYDTAWANVSNAPFRFYKHYVHEGGISTPLIAHWPHGFPARPPAHNPTHVVDILPTILEATGTSPLKELHGHTLQPLEGESLLALFKEQDWMREQPIFFEHEGNAAIRLGAFKLVKLHGHDWELYHMESDRTELHNLAFGERSRKGAMIKEYEAWADRVGVMDWDIALPRLLKAWNLKSVDG